LTFFASDNGSPVLPQVMAALNEANRGFAPSYGSDPLMDQVRTQIRTLFEAPEAAVYLVATGTAANALSLAILTPPWGAVFCHRNAHVEEDECGAPEFFTGGAKLVLVEGDHAKITPSSLATALNRTPKGPVHHAQPAALSLTNATEYGTVYWPDEIKALTGVARSAGLTCHMDGSRFANALAAAGCSPAEMTWRAGIDVLSLGGTKNGLMGAEAVVIFDPARAWEFELRRKRAGHLFSKHRYLSAQMAAYLTDGLWLQSARHANAMAARLSAGIKALPAAALVHPTEANMVFAHWPRAGHARAQAAGAVYNLVPPGQSLNGPPDQPLSARLVCNWCTTAAEVDAMLALIDG
jgi:threonine aldolase